MSELEAELIRLRQEAQVSEYTQEFNRKQEKKYQEEIQSLRRQLLSYSEGREYEKEILIEKRQKKKEIEEVCFKHLDH